MQQPVKRLITLLREDKVRMDVLSIVHSLALPDCYVAAGFIRNLVWDSLHSRQTPINDIDVIFFDDLDSDNEKANIISQYLNQQYPDFLWQAKNQAFMHVRNGDARYHNTVDAMAYWPEQETAVAAALKDDGAIEIKTSFGLEGLFLGHITHNPKRTKAVFLKRIESKHWLNTWPKLEVIV